MRENRKKVREWWDRCNGKIEGHQFKLSLPLLYQSKKNFFFKSFFNFFCGGLLAWVSLCQAPTTHIFVEFRPHWWWFVHPLKY